jgi:transposase-like protein
MFRKRGILCWRECPERERMRSKRALQDIFYAASLEGARVEAGQFLSRYSWEFPTPCEILAGHLEECPPFSHFRERHWKHIRTSTVIERVRKEVKRRTTVVVRFPDETSALVTVFSLLEEGKVRWQKVGMKSEVIAWIEEASKVLPQELVSRGFWEEALAACVT